jgi:hypothetical protein
MIPFAFAIKRPPIFCRSHSIIETAAKPTHYISCIYVAQPHVNAEFTP